MEPSPEKWEKVKALFEAALELEPAAAAAFLAEACPDDEIRKEVERLLANRPRLDGFLSEAAESRGEDAEALAYAVLARSLLAQGRRAESEQPAERADRLAAKSEDRSVHLFVALDRARVLAAQGKSGEAKSRLRSALAEATRLHYCEYELKVRLALGEIETDSGDAAAGHARLEALKKDAQTKGFGLIARDAAADLATTSPAR